MVLESFISNVKAVLYGNLYKAIIYISNALFAYYVSHVLTLSPFLIFALKSPITIVISWFGFTIFSLARTKVDFDYIDINWVAGQLKNDNSLIDYSTSILFVAMGKFFNCYDCYFVLKEVFYS